MKFQVLNSMNIGQPFLVCILNQLVSGCIPNLHGNIVGRGKISVTLTLFSMSQQQFEMFNFDKNNIVDKTPVMVYRCNYFIVDLPLEI